MKIPVSVIVLTYNEEKNLPQCLTNVTPYADQVIVVDSFSDDKTLSIAKKFGATVLQHKFKDQASQFNWALRNADIKHEWILRLDADEWVTKELWDEIARTLPDAPEDVSGFYMKRRVYFMNRWIKHGGYYPTWLLRLFRKGKGESETRRMDEHIVLSKGRAEKLQHDFADQNQKDLTFWTEKHNNFASREVEEVTKSSEDKMPSGQAQRKRWLKKNLYYKLPLFFRALAFWKYRYIIRGGFLDGKEGLIFHFLQGFWYRFLIDAKLFEQHKNHHER